MALTAQVEFTEELLEALCDRVRDSVQQTARYVTRDRLCAMLGTQPRTIQTWRTRGLPGVRVGKIIMYSVDEVEKWIEEQA